MTLLITYVLLALGVSFLCSIAEAVLLSVTRGYAMVLEQEGKRSGVLLQQLKTHIDKPLAAILTLNTIAHTVGATGAGAQATVVFGSAYIGIFSAVLTLLILIFSEIIPKTLGAHYWRALAPVTAYLLRYLIVGLYPLIKASELITRCITRTGPHYSGFDRSEFSAMADLSSEEGHLDERESSILKNLMVLRQTPVKVAMTPRVVLFSSADDVTVSAFCESHPQVPFSRIPIYNEDPDKIDGIVLLNDILQAQVRGEGERSLRELRRKIPALLDSMTLTQALEEFLREKTHMILVVTEYGSVVGIITLEDVLETLLGLEIVDEKDKTRDMQELARRHWRRQSKKLGWDEKTEE
ncbi:MAG TPA: hemolysin family protein [Cellvibrionaceae bacterium]